MTKPLIAIAIAIAFVGSSTSVVRAELLFNVISPGQTAIIMTRANGTPCFDTLDSFNEAQHDAEVHDEDGFSQLVNDGHVHTLHAGQRVRAIDTNPGLYISALRFRLLSGNDAGVACWVNAQADSFVKDVH